MVVWWCGGGGCNLATATDANNNIIRAMLLCLTGDGRTIRVSLVYRGNSAGRSLFLMIVELALHGACLQLAHEDPPQSLSSAIFSLRELTT